MNMQTLTLLIATCAPAVDAHTMHEVVRIESSYDETAININGMRRQPPKPKTAEGVAKMARAHIARGKSVDLGLTQTNSQHLATLGLTVEQVLDPCTNIKAGAFILTDAYARASKTRPDEQVALKAALSAYNTGSPERGFLNGYVARYYGTTPPDAPPQPPAEASRAPDHGDSYARQIEAVMQVEGLPEDEG